MTFAEYVNGLTMTEWKKVRISPEDFPHTFLLTESTLKEFSNRTILSIETHKGIMYVNVEADC